MILGIIGILFGIVGIIILVVNIEDLEARVFSIIICILSIISITYSIEKGKMSYENELNFTLERDKLILKLDNEKEEFGYCLAETVNDTKKHNDDIEEYDNFWVTWHNHKYDYLKVDLDSYTQLLQRK